MRMKICFIAPKAYPIFNGNIKSTFGGAAMQLYLLSEEFSNYPDVAVSSIVADYGQKDVEVYDKTIVYRSLNFKKNVIKQVVKFFRVFNMVKADVYVQRTLTPVSGILALYCKITNKKFVYMVAHDREVDGTYERKNGFLNSYIANLVFKCADLVIVQNSVQENNLRGKGRSSILLRSGFNIDNISKLKKNHVLWVGRSEYWKNPEMFLKLARLNPKNKFIMVCSKATNQYKYHSKIKNLALKIKNLQFIEFVPYSEIDTYFKEAKVFINTSDQEGFPNTFIQAMKNKTPIVSLNVNPDDVLNKYQCGFICENCFEVVNQYLDKLLHDQKLYKKMSESAYKCAKKNHDIKKNAKQFYNLIRDELYAKK